MCVRARARVTYQIASVAAVVRRRTGAKATCPISMQPKAGVTRKNAQTPWAEESTMTKNLHNCNKTTSWAARRGM
jgi:hypothetical protein